MVQRHDTFSPIEKPPPFHIFLTGGAGVGKNHLVRTIVQTATRLL
jgi:DNA replication protein DnaC